MKKRQRVSYEEEAEVLLWRRGRVAVVKKRQRCSCKEEAEVFL
jgi:hypothetical protein